VALPNKGSRGKALAFFFPHSFDAKRMGPGRPSSKGLEVAEHFQKKRGQSPRKKQGLEQREVFDC